jgi:hypothetical protein
MARRSASVGRSNSRVDDIARYLLAGIGIIKMRMLSVFDELYKTRSVSRTAENLNMSQTSVSLALARMRRQFNDALFVRSARGMVPTPHAAELIGRLPSPGAPENREASAGGF